MDPNALAEREALISSLLVASEQKHAELSDQMINLYEQSNERYSMLRNMEKTLSSQAGSLLKRLQSEEGSAALFSSAMKRYKNDHKKLLAKISNPRWEIPHHYHMTCIEHQLGHRQPHVLDVAELLPGHLRIYSLARCSSLYKRTLTYYTAKSKADRNSVSDSIQESYKRLREVRKEMKEVYRIIEIMKEKFSKTQLVRKEEGKTPEKTDLNASPSAASTSASVPASNQVWSSTSSAPSSSSSSSVSVPPSSSAAHLLAARRRQLGMSGPPQQNKLHIHYNTSQTHQSQSADVNSISNTSSNVSSPPSAFSSSPSLSNSNFSSSATPPSSSSSSSISSSSNYRVKYLKSLSIAPKLDFLGPSLSVSSSSDSRAKDMADSYNSDLNLKHIHQLLHSLDQTNKTHTQASQELTTLQSYRKRMGISSLHTPVLHVADEVDADVDSKVLDGSVRLSGELDSPRGSESLSEDLSVLEAQLQFSMLTGTPSNPPSPLLSSTQTNDNNTQETATDLTHTSSTALNPPALSLSPSSFSTDPGYISTAPSRSKSPSSTRSPPREPSPSSSAPTSTSSSSKSSPTRHSKSTSADDSPSTSSGTTLFVSSRPSHSSSNSGTGPQASSRARSSLGLKAEFRQQ